MGVGVRATQSFLKRGKMCLSLTPYSVCNKNADVADDFDIPRIIIDTSTGKQQEAQWIRGMAKGSFDGFHFATWVKDRSLKYVKYDMYER